MTEPLSPDALAQIARLLEQATPGPWAWEWIAEKSNEWAVGQAFRVDPATDEVVPIEGHFTESDDTDIETVIERRACVGLNESGHASASDAELICALRNAAPALIAAQRTLHQIEQWAKKEIACTPPSQAVIALKLRELLARLTPQGTPQEPT